MTTFEKELSKNQLEVIDIIIKYHIEKQKVLDIIKKVIICNCSQCKMYRECLIEELGLE